MKKAKKIAQILRDKLAKHKSFVGLYLYGSQINGKARADSDIDIVAVFDRKSKALEDSILNAWDLELLNDVIIDFHPFLLKQIEKDPFYFNEVKKGIYYGK